MIIDVTRLNNGIENKIELKNEITLSEEILKTSSILSIKKLNITGTIEKDIEGYYINAILEGTIVLPDSLTLNPTDYQISTEINGNIQELLEEIGKNDKKVENTIDIFPIIWENILMEIPIRVENEESRNIELKGDGWKVITDEESSNLNPELQKLKDLLK